MNENESFHFHNNRDVYNRFIIFMRKPCISDEDIFEMGYIHLLYCQILILIHTLSTFVTMNTVQCNGIHNDFYSTCRWLLQCSLIFRIPIILPLATQQLIKLLWNSNVLWPTESWWLISSCYWVCQHRYIFFDQGFTTAWV